MSRTRRSFTPEFKVEAARRVIDGGRSVAEVARELNVHENLFRKWVAAERVRDGAAADARGVPPDANGARRHGLGLSPVRERPWALRIGKAGPGQQARLMD